jgi:hypothetical protein
VHTAPAAGALVARVPRPRQRSTFLGGYFQWRAVSAFVVLIVMLVSKGPALFGQLTDDGRPGGEFVTSSQSTAWPDEVLPIARFVETQRGLTFDHSVPVTFLPDDEFNELFAAPSDQQPTADDVSLASRYFDAVGLAKDYDPFAGQRALEEGSVLGLYRFDDTTVYVRGEDLTPAVKVVLAHELTHALQHQHFAVEPGGANDLQQRALVEADASRIEDAYLRTLGAAEQQQALADMNVGGDPSELEYGDIPPSVIDSLYAPYVIGPQFLDARFAAGGNAGVDAALRDIPSQEELLAPETFGAGADDVTTTAPVPDGAIVVYENAPVPLYDVLQMMDAWLPWAGARTALDGWAGGSSATFESSEGVLCVSFSIVNDTIEYANLLATTLGEWAAAAMSSATPTVDSAASQPTVNFTACERPAGASTPAKPAFTTSSLAYLETAGTSWITTHMSRGAAADRCAARQMVESAELGPMFAELGLAPDQERFLSDAVTVSFAACGA